MIAPLDGQSKAFKYRRGDLYNCAVLIRLNHWLHKGPREKSLTHAGSAATFDLISDFQNFV
jgi:hypothetical protein